MTEIGDLVDDFEKCLIRKNQNQGKRYPVDNNEDGFRFDSPENLQVWFSTPQQLAELIVRDTIMDYTMYNTEERTKCIRIEGRCLEYRDVYNLKLVLNEMKSIMETENEVSYGEKDGYYLDVYQDGVLLTFMSFGEDDDEEEEQQTNYFDDAPTPIIRASIFICKPKPVEGEEDI